MSLSIRAISKAKIVECNGYVDEEAEVLCDHDEVGSCPNRRDGLKPGCYVPGKGGRSFSLRIWYKDYGDWMRELCRFALGAEWEEVCEHPQRFRGKPFVELIDFPYSSDGQTIGARTSSKLHADFAGFAAKARRHFLKAPGLAWMWEVYRDFRKAFKIGSDGGFVSYW
jgi:hypothetical protein